MWVNYQQGIQAIRERLDRILCNERWQSAFPKAWVHHLPRTHSDHYPILICLESHLPPCQNRPFQIEVAWVTLSPFKGLVRNVWNYEGGNLTLTTSRFTDAAREWNYNVFDNIFHCKWRLLAWLEGIQKALGRGANLLLESLEKKKSTLER